MNTIKLKHKIALSCNGDLKKYFSKIEKINKLITNKNSNSFKNKEYIEKLIKN